MTMTIDEALNRAEALSAGLNWILLSQYEVRSEYTSPEVPIDLDDRVIGDLSENVSTEGENNAEYISFIMDRYHDGVDLSNMLIQVQYELEDGSGSIDGVVNAYMNDDQIKFGWVVPPAAAQIDAVIKIIVFCTGTIGAKTYTLKTLPIEYKIHSTLDTGGSIPEPDENWYLQFANTMQQNILAAKSSADAAAQSASDASSYASNADESANTANSHATIASEKASEAATSADTATVKASRASESATLAKSYASGGTGTRPGEDEDNAYYYMTQAKKQTGDIPTLISQLENDIGFITEEEVNERLGDADISGIGDGTVTGVINELNSNLDGLGYGENGAYNLLKPTLLEEVTKNGVTCTPNKDENGNFDGTYILNGTATGKSEFIIGKINGLSSDKRYMLVGCPTGGSLETYSLWSNSQGSKVDKGDGISAPSISFSDSVRIVIAGGTVCNKLLFKPMVTTDLNATYDGYKPYIPSVKMLAEEVSAQNDSLEALELSDISGGKNIIDIYNPMTVTGTWYTKHKFKCKRNTTYVLSFVIDSFTNHKGIAIYDLNSNKISDISVSATIFNSGDNDELYLFLYSGNDTSGTSVYSNIQIEEGTTATPYKPYIPSVKMLSDKTTQIDDNNMLGWVVPEEMPIKNYVDSDGVFHQHIGRVDLSTLDWILDSSSGEFYTTGVKDIIKVPSANSVAGNVYMHGYKNVNRYSTATNDKVVACSVYGSIVINDTSYTDAATFKEAMSGVYLYYELAEEIKINVDGNEAVTKVKNDLGGLSFSVSGTTLSITDGTNTWTLTAN